MSVQCCGEAMTYCELPEFYDGALFLECYRCGARRHRFPEGHWLRERAERAIKAGAYTLNEGSKP